VGAVYQMHGYVLSASGRFRIYLQLVTSRNNQETSLGACVLGGRAHETVDQFFQNHLASNCLRDFDYRREIQEFDRCHNGARGAWIGLVLEVWMHPEFDRRHSCARGAASGRFFPEVWIQMV
jgi:hypothetical protein